MQPSVCILPFHRSVGGPRSFTAALTQGLAARGIEVHHDPGRTDTTTILVIAGTSRLDMLWRARRRGVRIVQRLDGMNWTHKKVRTGLRHYLRAEWGNWVLSTTRSHLADSLVYQSQFTQGWWQRVYGEVPAKASVIHNGVDLAFFNPQGAHNRPADAIRLQVVEGSLGGGHELGLENAVRMAQTLMAMSGRRVELVVAGKVPPIARQKYDSEKLDWITWAGVVERAHLPEMDRSAHFYVPCEINAACPNALIEALACGLPIAGYDSGAITELTGAEGGCIVPYGDGADQMGPADAPALAAATLKVLADWETYHRQARARAEHLFSVETMVEKYLQVLL
ncbi:MAG TPA: glycosyltransferase family 4 protein [Longilinea sp.]|nr:glycosyltransferase family 4 protein [Longilinea sp.]